MNPSWPKQREFWDFCYSCWVLSSSESCQACERTARREPWLRTKPPTQRKAEPGDGQLDTAISEVRWPRTLRSHEPIKILFLLFLCLSSLLFTKLIIQWIFLCSMPGCREMPSWAKCRIVWYMNLSQIHFSGTVPQWRRIRGRSLLWWAGPLVVAWLQHLNETGHLFCRRPLGLGM